MKYFWDPPPPEKRLMDTNVRDTATRTIAMNTRNVLVASWVQRSACIHSHTHNCLSIPTVRDLVFTRSRLSNSLLYNYAGTNVSPLSLIF